MRHDRASEAPDSQPAPAGPPPGGRDAVESAGRNTGARSLVHGVGFSSLAQAAPLLTNLVLTPYLIRHLGLDRFGVWSLMLVFLATLTVLDGGIGASLARFHARSEERR